uniref:Holin n=1 Tax=viral metagenome TaxID=1070528 RepID=A0A6M3K309_9ZZZZ
MDLVEQIAKFLYSYGGWGVAVLLGVAIRNLYKDFKETIGAKDALIQTLNENHHNEIVAVVTECTGILTLVKDALARCEARQQARERN